MANGPLNDHQVRAYHANGFLQVKGFFDAEEVGLLRRAAKEDHELDRHSFGWKDGEGGVVRLPLWNHPGATLYGMFVRCESMVNSAERLLGGEVYYYHSKMIPVASGERRVRRRQSKSLKSAGLVSDWADQSCLVASLHRG